MSSAYFPEVRRWLIPTAALEASFAEMRADGRERGTEGIALWLGDRSADARITHVVRLRGAGVVREPDYVQISDALLNDVTDETIRLGATLLGQVHSHGPLASTDLSWIDKNGGVRVPFYVSVVAPAWASGVADISTCGVHVFEPPVGWRRLGAYEVAARVLVVPGAAEVITVAGDA